MTLPALFKIHPPPWTVVEYALDPAMSVVRDAQGGVVGVVMPTALARLLAAAPGLVEALEGLLGDLASYGGMVSVEECDKARAALAALKEET